jgi:hypothetical protein
MSSTICCASSAPAHARRRPRPARHRESATLGPRRSDPGAARRGTHRPPSLVGQRSRRKAAGFPTGKTFDGWDETVSSIPEPTQRALRTLEWIDRHENIVVCGPSGTGKSHFLEALGHAASTPAPTSHGSASSPRRPHRTATEPTTPPAGPSDKIMRADVIIIDDIGLLPVTADTAEALYRVVDAAYEKRSIASHPTCTPPASTNSCPRPSPTRPSTGSCTTHTSCSPPATASASPKPPPARG